MFTLTFCRLLTFAFLIGSLPVGVRNESFNGMDCFMCLPVNVFALSRFA